MKTIVKILFLLMLTGCSITNIPASSNLRTLVNLSGTWLFSLGDEKDWSAVKFDDSKWDQIKVPSSWENQGYVEYDGYAWYRKSFSLPQGASKYDICLQIGNIDDVDKIFINGHLIGQTGKFAPNYTSGYGNERIYRIPANILNYNSENIIAVRVYDDQRDGGITSGPVRLVYNEDEENLDYKLDGEWKFSIKDRTEYADINYDDSSWKTIKVPQSWQSQGYWGFYGYAWYRYKFEIDPGMDLDNKYLVLGKIDDYDQVYVNGKLIGQNWSKTLFGNTYFHNHDLYKILRGYKIPKNLLKPGINVIAVRVFDHGGVGGIYEGPIGITNKNSWEDMRRKNENQIKGVENFYFGNFFE
ncbi:MAG TPA: beta galactosidase jelly roll domain-containing protein [Bacteroidales bacterium]|nr:beta galactosidase jelly roll domain-containing protein [Bacteroidales bacterium]